MNCKYYRCLSTVINVFVLLKILLTPIPYSRANLDKHLITSFFEAKFLKFGHVFDCLPIKEKIKLTKHLIKNNLRISENHINPNNSLLINNLYKFHHHFGIIVDGDCEYVEHLLKRSGQLGLFGDKYHWLIFASNEDIFQKLIDVKLNIDANTYITTPTKTLPQKVQNWTITDIYSPASHNGGDFKVITDTGFFNKKEGLKLNKKGNKYWIRRNMTGVIFKSMIVLRRPFKGPLERYLHSDENPKVNSYDRFQNKLISDCRDFYNFSIIANSTDSWGYITTNNNFDGLVGALQRKEVDFGLSAVFVKKERFPVVDYARGMWIYRSAFIFRNPSSRSFDQIFLHPMSTSVWYSILGAILLIVIVLKFTQKAEFELLTTIQNSVDQGWSNSILFVLGIFCQQGCIQTSILLCNRIITISVLLFCLLFYQFYSGSIVSTLLTKAPVKIKTLKQLADSSLTVASQNVPYIEDYFQRTNDAVVLELYHKKFLTTDNVSHYYTADHGMQLVQQGGLALQTETSEAYDIIERTFSNKAICELQEVQMLSNTILLPIFQKNSPFREMFNYCLQRLAEQGIGDRQKHYWGTKKPECLPFNSVSFNVSFSDTYPAIVLLIIGIVISLLILGLEVLQKKLQDKQHEIKKVNKSHQAFVN